jgi:hypothetical protein
MSSIDAKIDEYIKIMHTCADIIKMIDQFYIDKTLTGELPRVAPLRSITDALDPPSRRVEKDVIG